MKKIFTLLALFILGGQLHAQTVGPDQLDQIKRLARRNNHIEKTYQGTVEKLVYSFRDIGGPLTGVIFKRNNGKMMLVKFYRWQGKFIKPYLVEGESVTLTVKGDPLLLDVVIYKDQYFRELEFSIQAPINGIADLEKVTSDRGSFDKSDIKRSLTIRGLNPEQENLFNVQVNRRTRLDKLREMLIMENGDSLIISANTKYSEEIGTEVSYTRMVRNDENPMYYRNPNVYYLYGGKETMELLVQYGVWQINTNLIRKQELSLVQLSSGSDGIVDKAIFSNSLGEEIELKFNSKDATQVKQLFENDNKHQVHFQPSQKRNQILAIENGNELIELSKNLSNSNNEIYNKDVSSHKGEITRLITTQLLDIPVPEVLNEAHEKMKKEAGSGYVGLLIDDKTYVVIPAFTRLNIGNDIKEGEQIELSGFLRKKLPNEIRLRDYQIYYPKEITLGRKVYKVKEPFRRQ